MRASPPMLVSLLVSVVSLSCIAEPTTDITVPLPVASLSVEPTNAVVLVGSSTQLSAVARDSSGGTLSGRVTTWTSSARHIASLEAPGVIKGVAPGTAEIIATSEGKSDTAAITVTSSPAPPAPPTLTQLILTPASITLTPGGSSQFAVAATWSDGSSTLPAVTFSATGGTVTPGGLYTAGTTPGSYRVVAVEQGGTVADTATVTLTTLPGQQPIWTADMETGNLKQWEDNVYQATPCGGQFNTGDGFTVPSMDYARSGLWSAKLTISGEDTAASPNGTRMHRWCESQRFRELLYSVWYYIPQRLTVRPDGSWMNVFQYKSKLPGASGSDPFFKLELRTAPTTGAMRFILAWSNGLTIEGPRPGQYGFRTWQTTDTLPVGRWFQVQARYVCAGDFTGAVQVWRDGVEIFKLDSVRTRYPDGDCQWGVNNYGTGISPSPVIIYIDDAAIAKLTE